MNIISNLVSKTSVFRIQTYSYVIDPRDNGLIQNRGIKEVPITSTNTQNTGCISLDRFDRSYQTLGRKTNTSVYFSSHESINQTDVPYRKSKSVSVVYSDRHTETKGIETLFLLSSSRPMY